MPQDRIVVLDLETTWLLGPEALPIDQQPRIIEVGVVVLSKTKGLKKLDSFSSLLNPGAPIPEESVKITGITDEMVKDAPSFAGVYNRLVELFFGSRTLVAHNLPFDRGVLIWELQRIGKTNFYSFSEAFNPAAVRFKEKLGAKVVWLGLHVEIFRRYNWHWKLREYAC